MNVLPRFKGLSIKGVRDSIERFPFSVAMYNTQYGCNMGTVLRCCNAFAASFFIQVGKKRWDRRPALGVQNYETIIHHETWEASLNWMRSQNLTPIGIDFIENKSAPFSSATLKDLGEHPVFIFGEERNGLPTSVINACEKIYHIDQYGSIPSLNVGVAAGIIMNEWHGKRRNANNYR